MSLAPFSLRVEASVLRVTPLGPSSAHQTPHHPVSVFLAPLPSCPAWPRWLFLYLPTGSKPSTPALAFRILEQTSVSRIPPYLHVVHGNPSAGWKRISRQSISEGSDFIIKKKELR